MIKPTRVIRVSESGFTLIELIVTMMIIGILAVAVIPRFTHVGGFETRAFFDEAISMVRYGQKVAIAQRTNVFFNANPVTNRICLSYVTNPNCAAAGGVINPANQNNFLIVAPSGVTLGSSVEVVFSGLGAPNQAASLAITGAGVTRTITIEPMTGFIH